MFTLDKVFGEDLYQYYPKIIRAYSDVWSTKERQAEYKSPITSLIWSYLNFLEGENSSNKFKFPDEVAIKKTKKEGLKSTEKAFKHLQKVIPRIVNNIDDDFVMPPLDKLISDEHFKPYFGYKIETIPELKDFLENKSSEKTHKTVHEIINLLILANYLML